ncbi:hypothetical protein [Neptuniibacter sp. QD37_11]|uniref:hypothetical protein n=1 Tax=Neptuniibacter sp. QD37_11 TaxID=3398209 RepID=UPI0039F4FBEC
MTINKAYPDATALMLSELSSHPAIANFEYEEALSERLEPFEYQIESMLGCLIEDTSGFAVSVSNPYSIPETSFHAFLVFDLIDVVVMFDVGHEDDDISMLGLMTHEGFNQYIHSLPSFTKHMTHIANMEENICPCCGGQHDDKEDEENIPVEARQALRGAIRSIMGNIIERQSEDANTTMMRCMALLQERDDFSFNPRATTLCQEFDGAGDLMGQIDLITKDHPAGRPTMNATVHILGTIANTCDRLTYLEYADLIVRYTTENGGWFVDSMTAKQLIEGLESGGQLPEVFPAATEVHQ